MLEALNYTPVNGEKSSPLVTVYALSTCGFCKRAMTFLQNHGFAYRYVYMDQIPVETKNECKRELKETFKVDVAFPFATVGDSEYLVGFIEPDWKKTLGV
ncbi:MAG: glutaredoxin family protein [Spirochaetes bacterium]|nr:glutaredoxin family protein [Spirochaetota bacterium]MBU1082211.1 glutaredoxin family protein [Spirochaetota bacterium]